MAELQNIEMVIKDEEEHGVYALSLVDTPATGDETVLLSAEKEQVELSEVLGNNQMVQLAEVDKEKQLIMGVVLMPNQPIYRKSGEREYNIHFKAHTIEKAAYLYMSQLNNNNATVQHKKPVTGVSVVESWIVLDSQKDKSAMYGKEYPVGSWAVVMRVHDTAKWEEYKENGTTNISLEGVFKPKEEPTELKAEISTLEKRLNILKSISKGL